MPVAATFRRISPGPGSGTGTSSIRSGSRYPYILAARIAITCASLSLASRKRLEPGGVDRSQVVASVTAAAASLMLPTVRPAVHGPAPRVVQSTSRPWVLPWIHGHRNDESWTGEVLRRFDKLSPGNWRRGSPGRRLRPPRTG